MLEPNAELSTAQLAERTGVQAATLRMWESRHGFPSPARRPGGHRRYSVRDVEAVLDVLDLRRRGLSLTAAIERVRRPAPLGSIFAGLRQRRPEVAPTVLPKPLVLALSHAIEDEYCAHAVSGLLIAAFQRESLYRGAERRWRELARTADLAVVLAEFDELREPAGGPVEVPIGPRHALAREWALIVDAPGASACLAAWEQLSEHEQPDHDRRFEVLWSFEPTVVRSAVEVATDLLTPLAPAVAARIPSLVQDGSATTPNDLRFAAALSQRIVGYMTSALAEVGSNARRLT
jgi:MerR family transcriptional regulator, light-induced transcriptional regulator